MFEALFSIYLSQDDSVTSNRNAHSSNGSKNSYLRRTRQQSSLSVRRSADFAAAFARGYIGRGPTEAVNVVRTLRPFGRVTMLWAAGSGLLTRSTNRPCRGRHSANIRLTPVSEIRTQD